MTTKRLKAKGYSTREQFTSAINEIATLQTQLRNEEARRDKLIQRVQERYRERIDTAADAIDNRLALAEAYASEHRDEVIPAGRQTGETELAHYGFREHPPTLATLNSRWTWETVLAAVKRAFGARFVRTSEVLAKDEIKVALTDEQLAGVGLRLRTKETFGVTPKLDDAATEKAHSTGSGQGGAA